VYTACLLWPATETDLGAGCERHLEVWACMLESESSDPNCCPATLAAMQQHKGTAAVQLCGRSMDPAQELITSGVVGFACVWLLEWLTIAQCGFGGRLELQPAERLML
jgi:hypothetical protein